MSVRIVFIGHIVHANGKNENPPNCVISECVLHNGMIIVQPLFTDLIPGFQAHGLLVGQAEFLVSKKLLMGLRVGEPLSSTKI